MNSNIPTIGSSSDPARNTGWSTQDLPKGEIIVTVNDNDRAVYLHLNAATAQALIDSLTPFAKAHAPKSDRPDLDALRKIIFHRVKMWDAGSAAEKLLGYDIDTQSDAIDNLACAMNKAEDALDLDDGQLAATFDIDLPVAS